MYGPREETDFDDDCSFDCYGCEKCDVMLGGARCTFANGLVMLLKLACSLPNATNEVYGLESVIVELSLAQNISWHMEHDLDSSPSLKEVQRLVIEDVVRDKKSLVDERDPGKMADRDNVALKTNAKIFGLFGRTGLHFRDSGSLQDQVRFHHLASNSTFNLFAFPGPTKSNRIPRILRVCW